MIYSAYSCRLYVSCTFLLTYAVIPALPSISCQVEGRAYLPLCFEHPASTLPTRFPAALGIGHGTALRA